MRPIALRIAAGVVATAVCLPVAARAELGGPLASVQADSGRMSAHLASTTHGTFARHDMTRGNGGVVRELTNANGQVFAVTWAGPGKPDLRALLGRYFATFQASSGTATGHAMRASGRRPQQVNQSDLQIQTGGHMGWFRGVAFIPSLAPAGFSTSDLPVEP